MDDFLDSTYKEKISKEIIQNIKKKKLQDQNLNLSSDNNSCNKSESDIKLVNTIDTLSDKIEKSIETEVVQRLLEKFSVDSIEDNIKFINNESLNFILI